MDRNAAIRLVGKLEALADPKRGGTEAECAVARAKADALIKRFNLNRRETACPPPPRPRRFTASRRGGAWEFDIRTGAASSNVKVHRHNSVRDWKIEIF
jgi:hypothetical protein